MKNRAVFRSIMLFFVSMFLLNFTLPASAATNVPCDVTALINAISSASSGDTLDLAVGCTYTFTSGDDTHLGRSALPQITTNIIINGNGATLVRDGAAPAFRFFYVTSGGSLTLSKLTLSNGLSLGGNGGASANNAAGGGGSMGGNGGAASSGGAGGGGGSGFDGGDGGTSLGGGGGGGNNSSGHAGNNPNGGTGGAGLSGSGGSGGTSASESGGDGSGGGGGGGAYSDGISDENGGNGSDGGGGGGGGVVGSAAIGGNGGRGGGGGGGGGANIANSGRGGNGGFGGGGGGGGGSGNSTSDGGNGGFGGGGGGGGGTVDTAQGGSGGFGAGNGGDGTISGTGGGAGAGGGAGLGGAIFVDAGGALVLTDATFTDNQAQGGNGMSAFNDPGDAPHTGGGGGGAGMGGAIFVNGGSATITNSTFTNNSVQGGTGGLGRAGQNGGSGSGYGSAIFAEGGAVTLNDSTLSGNSASSGGTLYQHSGAAVTLNNSIIANSVGGDCIGAVSASHSLFMDGVNTCGIANGANGSIVGVDPMLGTLTGNPAYFPLNGGSSAIDTGDNSLIPGGITTDEAGGDRIGNSIVDMGAYEVPGAPSPTQEPTAPPSGAAPQASAPVTALCAEIDKLSSGAITVSGGVQNVLLDGVYGNTYCRLIALESNYVTSPAEIGVQSVIQLGVVDAVDVFGELPSGQTVVPFVSPVTVCLRGVASLTGDVLFLSASDASRTPQHLPATTNGSFLCVSVPNSGTVVLVGTASNIPAQPSAANEASPTTLNNCQVTTTHAPLNLRAEPNTSASVIVQLPYDLTLTATEHVSGWYRVIYLDGQGWVSADYVRTVGDCG